MYVNIYTGEIVTIKYIYVILTFLKKEAEIFFSPCKALEANRKSKTYFHSGLARPLLSFTSWPTH
jgi:hypothetical protein